MTSHAMQPADGPGNDSGNAAAGGRPRGKLGKLLGYLALGLVIVVAALAGIVAMQPADFSIARSATIAAPAPVVFEQVNDFHNWDAWSPWAKLDPNMKQSYEGAPAGAGAIYSWNGNSDVGEGRMQILESRPQELIKIQLDFVKPMTATNITEFTFQPDGEQTAVKWSMTGHNNFIGKAFSLIVDMDEMLGAQFEQGLAQMKTAAEAAPQP